MVDYECSMDNAKKDCEREECTVESNALNEIEKLKLELKIKDDRISELKAEIEKLKIVNNNPNVIVLD